MKHRQSHTWLRHMFARHWPPQFGSIRRAWFVSILSILAFNRAVQSEPNDLAIDNHLEYRLRVESLANDYRTGRSDSSVLFHRLLLQSNVKLNPFSIGIEIQDSRADGIDSIGAPSAVNPTDLLQIYATVDLKNAITQNDSLRLSMGRMTLDLGSRRLVARNRYRNTINGFSGALAHWKHRRLQLKAFAFFPVERRPGDPVLNARVTWSPDKENTNHVFGGFFLNTTTSKNTTLDAYSFINHINHQANDANSVINTTGLRLFRAASKQSLDFEVETVFQWGKSNPVSNQNSSTHLAGFAHASVGYTLNSSQALRIEGAFDIATGDSDANDNKNNRFDTLFGQPRGDFGPTGIYGAFTRSNIISTALALNGTLEKNLQWKIRTRLFWLASKRDAWVKANLIDNTGASGRYVGIQPEFQLKWVISPAFFVEAGGVVLVRGAYAQSVPGGHTSTTWMMYNDMGIRF